MVLVGGVHHAFKRIDATESDDDFIAPKLLETLRNLIANETTSVVARIENKHWKHQSALLRRRAPVQRSSESCLRPDLTAVFMDTTSLSFYGEGGETLGEHGYSKDYRPDLNR